MNLKFLTRNKLIIFFLAGTAVFLAAPSLYAQPKDELFSFGVPPQEATIEKIIRADLIILTTGERVRLIGLKAPEPPAPEKIEYDQYGFIVKNTKVTNTIEERAFALAQELLLGQNVRLEFDAQKRGADHNIQAYIFRTKDNLFVNAEILKQGLAELRLTPPNLKYENIMRAAYREAREQHRGLHSDF